MPFSDIFIADFNHNRIRKVDAYSLNIITVAGTGALGYNGDGIPATLASLSYRKWGHNINFPFS